MSRGSLLQLQVWYWLPTRMPQSFAWTRPFTLKELLEHSGCEVTIMFRPPYHHTSTRKKIFIKHKKKSDETRQFWLSFIKSSFFFLRLQRRRPSLWQQVWLQTKPRGHRDCGCVNHPYCLSAPRRAQPLRPLSRALRLFQEKWGERECVFPPILRRAETCRVKLGESRRKGKGGGERVS